MVFKRHGVTPRRAWSVTLSWILLLWMIFFIPSFHLQFQLSPFFPFLFVFSFYLPFQTCVFVLHRFFVNLDYTTNHHWAFFEFFMATSLIISFWGRTKCIKDVCKLRNIKWFFASASNKTDCYNSLKMKMNSTTSRKGIHLWHERIITRQKDLT